MTPKELQKLFVFLFPDDLPIPFIKRISIEDQKKYD